MSMLRWYGPVFACLCVGLIPAACSIDEEEQGGGNSVAASVCNVVACDPGDEMGPGRESFTPGCEPACQDRECGGDDCGGSCGECAAGHACYFGQCIAARCDDGNDVNWDGCTRGVVSEVLLNEPTAGEQMEPALTSVAGQEAVVAWQDDSADGAGYGIIGRWLTADGHPRTPPTLLNSYGQGHQQHVRLDAGGPRVVAVWQSQDQDGWGWGIFGQRLVADLAREGSEFQANVYVSDDQTEPDVAVMDDGRFMVVWQSYWQDMDGWGIFGRVFDPDGSPASPDVLVNAYTGGDQLHPAVVPLADGRYLVVWECWDTGGVQSLIYGRFILPEGVPQGDQFSISSPLAGFAVQADVASLPGGQAVVVWSRRASLDTIDFDVSGRLVQSDGTPGSAEFQVNVPDAGTQTRAAVAASAAGFVVAWQDEGGLDGDASGVFLQPFVPDGTSWGGKLQANIYFTDLQEAPAVAMFTDGTFLAAWMSRGQDGSGHGIFGRHLEAE